MKLFLALISMTLSISRRMVGKTTKELTEMSTDSSWLQWTSSLGRLERRLVERLRVVMWVKQAPNLGEILVMRLPERLQDNISDCR